MSLGYTNGGFQSQTKNLHPRRTAVGVKEQAGTRSNIPKRQGLKKITVKAKKVDEAKDDKKTRFIQQGREKHSPPWMKKDGKVQDNQKAKKGKRRGRVVKTGTKL